MIKEAFVCLHGPICLPTWPHLCAYMALADESSARAPKGKEVTAHTLIACQVNREPWLMNDDYVAHTVNGSQPVGNIQSSIPREEEGYYLLSLCRLQYYTNFSFMYLSFFFYLQVCTYCTVCEYSGSLYLQFCHCF